MGSEGELVELGEAGEVDDASGGIDRPCPLESLWARVRSNDGRREKQRMYVFRLELPYESAAYVAYTKVRRKIVEGATPRRKRSGGAEARSTDGRPALSLLFIFLAAPLSFIFTKLKRHGGYWLCRGNDPFVMRNNARASRKKNRAGSRHATLSPRLEEREVGPRPRRRALPVGVDEAVGAVRNHPGHHQADASSEHVHHA